MKKKLLLLTFTLVFVVCLFCGCSQGGFIPDRQGNQIEYVLIQESGYYWNKYTNVVSYHFNNGTGAVILTLTGGGQIITHCENVIIKLKGEQ